MPGAVTSSDHNFRTLLPGSKSRSEYKWALPANIVFDRVLHSITVRPDVRKDLLFLARATKSTYRASSSETALTAVAESILLIPISPRVDDLSGVARVFETPCMRVHAYPFMRPRNYRSDARDRRNVLLVKTPVVLNLMIW